MVLDAATLLQSDDADGWAELLYRPRVFDCGDEVDSDALPNPALRANLLSCARASCVCFGAGLLCAERAGTDSLPPTHTGARSDRSHVGRARRRHRLGHGYGGKELPARFTV